MYFEEEEDEEEEQEEMEGEVEEYEEGMEEGDEEEGMEEEEQEEDDDVICVGEYWLTFEIFLYEFNMFWFVKQISLFFVLNMFTIYILLY